MFMLESIFTLVLHPLLLHDKWLDFFLSFFLILYVIFVIYANPSLYDDSVFLLKISLCLKSKLEKFILMRVN